MYTTLLLPVLALASSTYAQYVFANASICNSTDDGFASIVPYNGGLAFVEVDCAVAEETCRYYPGSNNAYWTARLGTSHPHMMHASVSTSNTQQSNATPATAPSSAAAKLPAATKRNVAPTDVRLPPAPR